jgi:hypothetical protein
MSCAEGCDANGTYLLTYQGGCQWAQVMPTNCGGFSPPQYCYFGNGPEGIGIYFWATLGAGLWVVGYTLAGEVNCSGPNTFNFFHDGGTCSDWPATITLYPV